MAKQSNFSMSFLASYIEETLYIFSIRISTRSPIISFWTGWGKKVQLGRYAITKLQCHSKLINRSGHLTRAVPSTVPNVDDTNMKVTWSLLESI